MICRFLGLGLCLFSFFAFAEKSASVHLENLKSKFPYGLLNDDHGILTVNDLAANACEARPRPLSPDSISYQYWQCFESKDISFDCDSNGTADEYEGVMGLIVIKISTPKDNHEYLEHRLWPIKQCQRFIADAATLLKRSKYACLSGSFISDEIGRAGRHFLSWNFERIKTKKGCEGRSCDFNEKIKRESCPNLKF